MLLMLTTVRSILAVSCFLAVLRADPEFPPLPSELPSAALPSSAPVIRRPISIPRPPAFNPTRPTPPVLSYQPTTVGDDVLSWDSLSKEYTAKPGDTVANFAFGLTNVTKTNVVINW